jgi:glycopeptide antibiotics resistance protein
VGAILVLTLFPIDGDKKVELVPFGDIMDALAGRPVDVALLLSGAANILLFVPLGAGLALCGFSPRTTAVIGFVLSLCVESAQLLLVPGRTAAVDDVVFNTLGATLGHALLSRRLRARVTSTTVTDRS